MSSLDCLIHDRKLLTICAIDLVAGIGQGCTIPIFPIYVRSFGVSYLVVGLVISGAGAFRLLADIPVGIVLDRLGRKSFLRLSIFFLTISTIFPILISGIWSLLIFQIIQGLGMGILMIAVLTVTSDISPTNSKGTYVGCLFAADSLSVALGAFMGGKLVEIGGFQTPFMAMLILSIAAFLIVERFFKETLPSGIKTGIFRKMAIRLPGLNRNLLVALLGASVVSVLISGAGNTAIPLLALSLLLSPVEIGFALTTLWVANVLVQPWAGELCDRVGTKRLFIVGFALSSITLLFFFISKNFVSLEIASVLLGVSIGVASSTGATIIVESSGANARGLSTAFYRIFRDLGSMSGPIMVGVFSDLFGTPFAFVFIAMVCVATVMIGLTLHSKAR